MTTIISAGDAKPETTTCCYCGAQATGRPHPLFAGVSGVMRPCGKPACLSKYRSDTAWMQPGYRR